MAYATVANVTSEFKNITFSVSSPVTTAEVERFIEEADAHIEGVLSQKYVTPITGTTSLIIVRQISIWLVVQRVKDILAVKSGNQSANQEQGERLDNLAKDMLKDIIDENILLSDATLLDNSDGAFDYNSNNNITQTFKAGEDQW